MFRTAEHDKQWILSFFVLQSLIKNIIVFIISFDVCNYSSIFFQQPFPPPIFLEVSPNFLVDLVTELSVQNRPYVYVWVDVFVNAFKTDVIDDSFTKEINNTVKKFYCYIFILITYRAIWRVYLAGKIYIPNE